MKKKLNHNFKNAESESDISITIMKEIPFDKTDSSPNLEIINLQHPRYKKSAAFIYNIFNKTIQEILKFSQSYRSWFIGNTVVSDGKMFLCTVVDPLFLVLPYIYKAKMSSTLDQLIHDDNFKDSHKLESLVDTEQLSLIAEKKECRGLIVWKYNEENALSWLDKKVNKVASVLENKNFHVNSASAVSSTYVRSLKDKESREDYLRYAHGIISEYLEAEISDKLLSYLKLPPVEILNAKKRRTTDIDPEEIKRLKIECTEKELLKQESLSSENKSEKSRKNPKQAALAKAAAGSKSISSFFQKK